MEIIVPSLAFVFGVICGIGIEWLPVLRSIRKLEKAYRGLRK